MSSYRSESEDRIERHLFDAKQCLWAAFDASCSIGMDQLAKDIDAVYEKARALHKKHSTGLGQLRGGINYYDDLGRLREHSAKTEER